LSYVGRTIALYALTGAGKTTQAGEYAKYVKRTRGLDTVLNSSDRGGYNSLGPLVRAGIIHPNELSPEDDAFIWLDEAARGVNVDPSKVGCVIFDSGSSCSEALLSAVSKADFQVGQQKTQKFVVAKGSKNLSVAINNQAHYGIVQQYMLDAIWTSTWLTKKGIDVIWTFTVYKGEEQDSTPILGPKLAGKALTAEIPKWFQYTFRMDSIPVEGAEPRHVLYTTEHTELAGLGHSFGNARYPLGATPLPAVIEPASLVTVIELIEQGQKEADELIKAELGL
jgi:hypothetical protein